MKAKTPANQKSFFDLSPPEAAGPISSKSALVGGDRRMRAERAVYPGQFDPPARIITLEQNYRSTQPILDACNSVIGFAKERFTKNLRSDRKSKQAPFLTTVMDETAQARYVAQQILDARDAGLPLKSQATLFRASHHSAQLQIELARRNIPFVKYGGLKFLDTPHVKNVISVFRWAENPNDRVAAFRVLKLLPGIGPTTAAKVQDQVEA